MIKSIKNFLDKENFLIVKSIFEHPSFPWYYNDHKVVHGDGEFQFTHTFIEDHKVVSNCFDGLYPLINRLQPKSIRRIKVNLTFKETKIKTTPFHTDFSKKITGMKTAIYYLNTNNGHTIFKNKKKEKSIENKLVIFPSDLEHAGTTHTDVTKRMVLNINYYASSSGSSGVGV